MNLVFGARKIFAALLLTAICAGAAFCQEEKDAKKAKSERGLLGFQFAVGSGYTFYGDPVLKDNHKMAMDDGLRRLPLYTDTGITLRVAQPFHLLGGVQLFGDFIFDGGQKSTHLTTGLFFGGVFYPTNKNLSISLCYLTGFRRDWNELGEGYAVVEEAQWGHGFRLGLEIDFKRGGGFVPGLGFAYTFLPTGNNHYDNQLAAFVRFAFR